jgi:arabinose-5-phosphate isomerase
MAVLYEHVSGLSRESFAMNHPGGLLGKTLLLKVQDLMISVDDICLLEPHQTMNDVLIGMTSKPNGIACVVNKEKELLGIIVEGDIRRILTQHQDIKSLQVSQVMNLKPFSIEQWELAKEALELMESKGKSISVLPVLSGKKLVGILRLHDLVRQGLKG